MKVWVALWVAIDEFKFLGIFHKGVDGLICCLRDHEYWKKNLSVLDRKDEVEKPIRCLIIKRLRRYKLFAYEIK